MSGLFLVAQVAGHAIAVESSAVESVVDLGEVTPTPLAARHVLGLATLRSRVVTVLDTAGALAGVAGTIAPRRAIVSQIDGHHYAFVVDTLDDVAEFTPRPLAAGVTLPGIWARAVDGVIDRDGEAALVIDLTALVPGLQHASVD
ncbi:chemotaxis protein CheW [Sphingomonas sp.]|uniref:chemotaxis protein CheW n=1 Tax=Sphingomonas sp. TaxID=28214 RepID=UPI002D03FAAB|nr:chemotaxis protein CheW [Sphingomonas sp.]HTG37559.1 chemotaxis protein CheW [Sphingomonas sp.]